MPVLWLSWDGPPSASYPPVRARGLAGASSLGRAEWKVKQLSLLSAKLATGILSLLDHLIN